MIDNYWDALVFVLISLFVIFMAYAAWVSWRQR